MSIKILDCTLRDGGYINNWDFKDKHISKIINGLERSNIDIIECGYINDKVGQKENTTLFDNLDSADKILSTISMPKNKEIVIMINLGDYNVENLLPKSSTRVDGIRLAFHKKKLEEALLLGEKIINKGYKLYFQPMITKYYKDIEFLSMIDKVNTLKPYSFYIVDSFGSMTLSEFNKYLVLSDSNLDKDIALGYHSHNNMQLAFSNTISMCSKNFDREIIIDSSIYGMGRGAGNLNTELIADFLNNTYKNDYNTLPLLEIIDELLSSLKSKNTWGFSPSQYLSASFNCHPNYANYLVNKNTNHIVGIKKILEKLPEDKKGSFDKNYIELMYRESILEEKTIVNNKSFLSNKKKILLLASGKSTIENKELINNKISSDEYIVISLNHNSDFECDYNFYSNQKRYDEFKKDLNSEKLIITNNIYSEDKPSFVLDLSLLVLIHETIITNSTILLMNYLIGMGIKEVEIAGLDGYKIGFDNYSYLEDDINVDLSIFDEENKKITDAINILKEKIEINLITPSIFKELI